MSKEHEHKKPPINDVLKQLDSDVFEMPADDLRKELAQHGLTYETVSVSGLAFVQNLMRARKRAGWMQRADVDGKKIARRLEHSAEWIRKRALDLLSQGNPALQAAFRDRQPGDMTDEDLMSLAEEQAIAELLDQDEIV